MSNLNRKYFFAILLSAFVFQSQSQTLSDMEFQVGGVFQPTVADAVKINDNPVFVDTVRKVETLSYSINSQKINSTFKVDEITPAKMVGEPLSKLYNVLIKGGIGTYTTPYGEAFVNSNRSKDYSYGLRFKHISSNATLKDYGFAGYSDNEVNLFGKKFIPKHTLWGDLLYERDVVHYYGYDILAHDIEKDKIKQRFSNFGAKAGLKSYISDSTKINYDLMLKYHNIFDLYEANENNINAKGSFSGFVTGQKLLVGTEVDYYNNKTSYDTLNNTIVRLSPSIISGGEKWNVSLGLNVSADLSKIENKFYFYPNIDFNFNVFDNIIIPYAGVNGGLHKNSLKTLSDENPFVQTQTLFGNTDEKINVYGGIRGQLSKNTSYNLSAAYSVFKDMYFFVTDYSEVTANKFSLLYDDMNRVTLHGELGYQAKEKLKIIAKGDYFIYDMKNEIQPWHKSLFNIALSANYNLKDKIVAKADIFVIGKQYAKTFDTSGKVVAQELKPFTDVNIGLEYRYSKFISAFINFNNIASMRYNRWLNYPTQKFNLLGGFSFAF